MKVKANATLWASASPLPYSSTPHLTCSLNAKRRSFDPWGRTVSPLISPYGFLPSPPSCDGGLFRLNYFTFSMSPGFQLLLMAESREAKLIGRLALGCMTAL